MRFRATGNRIRSDIKGAEATHFESQKARTSDPSGHHTTETEQKEEDASTSSMSDFEGSSHSGASGDVMKARLETFLEMCESDAPSNHVALTKEVLQKATEMVLKRALRKEIEGSNAERARARRSKSRKGR